MAERRRPAYDKIERAARRDSASPSPDLGIAGLVVPPMSEETRDDARRAVTRFHTLGILGVEAAGEVLEALGLIRVKPAVVPVNPTDVACPRCDAEPKYPCRPMRGTTLRGPHIERQAAAQEARA